MKNLTLLVLTVIGLVSCGKKDPSLEIKNSIRVNILQEPVTYDPRRVVDYTSTTLSFLLFEGLTRMTPDSASAKGLADSITVSPDGLKYTFHLREAKWSNGIPITAYDFSESWLNMLDPTFPAPNAHLLFPIKNAEKAKRGKTPLRDVGINVLNYDTIEVVLEAPTPYFLELISYCVFSPVCQSHVNENPSWAEATDRSFVCNGPYRLAKRRINSEIILEKNPYYWDADSVNLDQISISIVDNETTALSMFKSNKLDMIGLPFTGIPTDAIPDFLSKGMIETTEIPATTICAFNLDRFPFTNKNIRKAFAIALNRQEIVENITQTGEIPGMKLLPDTLIPNQPKANFKDGDIETALDYLNKGLEELGITKDELPQITMLHASTGIYPKVAQAIQEQWRKSLGVNLILQGYEYKVFLDRLNKKDFNIAQCIWVAQYYDPMNILDRFRVKENAKNYPGYDNEQYRNLIDGSVYFANKEKRFAHLNKALNVINEDVPLTAVYHWKSPYMKKSYIKDLFVQPTGFFQLTKINVDNNKTPNSRPVNLAVK